MPQLLPIRFAAIRDVYLLRKRYQYRKDIAAEDFLVAADGETYFIPDVIDNHLSLPPIKFITKSGMILTGDQIRDAFQNKNTVMIASLVFNNGLADMLKDLRFSPGKPVKCRLPRAIPLNPLVLVYPLLEITQSKTYEEYVIRQWIDYLRRNNHAVVHPGTDLPLDENHLLPNVALQNLIWVVVRQHQSYKKYYEKQPSEANLTREIAATGDFVEDYLDSLREQKRLYEPRISFYHPRNPAYQAYVTGNPEVENKSLEQLEKLEQTYARQERTLRFWSKVKSTLMTVGLLTLGLGFGLGLITMVTVYPPILIAAAALLGTGFVCIAIVEKTRKFSINYSSAIAEIKQKRENILTTKHFFINEKANLERLKKRFHDIQQKLEYLKQPSQIENPKKNGCGGFLYRLFCRPSFTIIPKREPGVCVRLSVR